MFNHNSNKGAHCLLPLSPTHCSDFQVESMPYNSRGTCSSILSFEMSTWNIQQKAYDKLRAISICNQNVWLKLEKRLASKQTCAERRAKERERMSEYHSRVSRPMAAPHPCFETFVLGWSKKTPVRSWVALLHIMAWIIVSQTNVSNSGISY